MSTINPGTAKKQAPLVFGVELSWLLKNKGILSAHDVQSSLAVAKPVQFGGEGKEWSPEHLFLGSLSSCFMNTYLVFAKKLEFEISHLECNSTGKIELVDGRYEFTTIDIYPKIYIVDENKKEQAIAALQKTEKYCLISNSVRSEITYHGEVLPASEYKSKESPLYSYT